MICFAWDGFPQYGARAVAALVHATTERVVVLATRPSVPVEGMEMLAGCEVRWLQSFNSRDGVFEDGTPFRGLHETFGETPRALFTSGWRKAQVRALRREVRAAKGRVFALCDNDCQVTWRTLVKALHFRLFVRRNYDGVFVPGVSGARLMRLYGMPPGRVATGMYTADETLFHDGSPLRCRPKRLLFIGRLIPRKNVVPLCQAFLAAGGPELGWTLELFGAGVQRGELERLVADSCVGGSIRLHDFLQPEEIAEEYRRSRVFCLPSQEEHWGLVVHEAVLSGCLLLLSDRIGAAADFLGERNGVVFSPDDSAAFTDALRNVMSMSEADLEAAQAESLELAKRSGLFRFVAGVRQLLG